MEEQTPYIVIQCLRPICRFRYPAGSQLSDDRCPKCGGPTRKHIFARAESGISVLSAPWPVLEVLLDNVRSAYNTGSILRTADAVKLSHVHLCGATPTPDNPKVRKTALGAEFSTAWTQHWNSVEAVAECLRRGYQVAVLEIAPGSISLFELNPERLHFPILLVLGNEVTGVDPDILKMATLTIELPMLGEKSSINVATAFGIVAYFLRYIEHTKEKWI